jgi:hypothetical protein
LLIQFNQLLRVKKSEFGIGRGVAVGVVLFVGVAVGRQFEGEAKGFVWVEFAVKSK